MIVAAALSALRKPLPIIKIFCLLLRPGIFDKIGEPLNWDMSHGIEANI